MENSSEIVDSFKRELQEQEDQRFGLLLFYEGIRIIYAGKKLIIKMNQKAINRIVKRLDKALSRAKQLLRKVEEDPSKIEQLKEFQFPPISGHPMMDEMTRRVQLLIEIYDELFPGRSRTETLGESEMLQLFEEASERYF